MRGDRADARRRARPRRAAHPAVRPPPADLVPPRPAGASGSPRPTNIADLVPTHPGNLVGFGSRQHAHDAPMHLSKLHATGNDFLVRLALDGAAVDARRAYRRRAVRPPPRDRRRRPHHGRAGARRRRLHDDARQRRRWARRDERQRDPLPRVGRGRARGSRRDDELAVDTAAGRRARAAATATATRSSRPRSTWAPVTFDPAQIPVDVPTSVRPRSVGRRPDLPRRRRRAWATRTSCSSSTIPRSTRVTTHGPVLEHDPRFPRRTNVEFVAVDAAPTDLRMRVWERGVGETQSCGTGACAAAAVAHRRGLVGDRVTVDVLGGALAVALGDTVRLGGPVVHVFDVDVDVVGDRVRVGPMSPSRAHQNRQRPRLTATEVDLERRQQRALLVGTGYGTTSVEEAEASLDELALLTETAGAEPVDRVLQRRSDARPRDLHRQGQGRGAAAARRSARRRRRDLRRRAHARAAAQPREDLQGRRRRPRRADPRHLRPARDEPGGHGAGRARAAPLPLAAPARPGPAAEPAGWRHRHPARSGRDAARGRPAAAAAAHPEARTRPQGARGDA